jgi:hypothetical protein
MSEEKQGQPPEHLPTQPGNEHQMQTEPDFSPRYPGQRQAEGQGGPDHRWRFRDWPRHGGPVCPRRREAGDPLS